MRTIGGGLFMALTECANGHLYDTDLNNTCPYCNGGSNFINFSTQSDSDFGKTVAPCAYVKKQEKDHRTIGAARIVVRVLS